MQQITFTSPLAGEAGEYGGFGCAAAGEGFARLRAMTTFWPHEKSPPRHSPQKRPVRGSKIAGHDTPAFKPRCPDGIGDDIVWLIVLIAVRLDHQFLLKADKVHDIRTYGLLSPELVTAQPTIAQSHPKPAFGICVVSAQLPRQIVFHRFIIARMRANPSPMRVSRRFPYAHTSPARGRAVQGKFAHDAAAKAVTVSCGPPEKLARGDAEPRSILAGFSRVMALLSCEFFLARCARRITDPGRCPAGRAAQRQLRGSAPPRDSP